MRERPHAATIVVAIGALLGLLFASVSTADFAKHLDRQVHDVHCSFMPGLSGPESGESGCQVTMVSHYSSVFRASVWGGVPISLPAMAVFAFLALFAAELVLTSRQRDVRATGFLALATALPALTSLVMAYVSLAKLDAVCKLCIGIYLSSAIALGGAVALWLRARKLARFPDEAPAEPPPSAIDHEASGEPAWVSPTDRTAPAMPRPDSVIELTRKKTTPVSWRYLSAAFGVGVLLVVLATGAYVTAAPDHSRFIGTCGQLVKPKDDYGVMVALDPHRGAPPAIEVLDPLCPACRGFEERLAASGLDQEMDRHALLFPLDDRCNWMVDTAIHPGACAVSEAMLCAGDRAGEVLEWAFAHQEEIRAAAAERPEAAEQAVEQSFPDLARCVGSAEVRSRLNRSLRWAVANRLPVLTPQLYVGGVKLCEEDVDLGLEFALTRMLSAHREGRLRAVEEATP